MKKVLSVLLVMVLLIAVVGCGGGAEEPSQEPAAPGDPEPIEEKTWKVALITSGPVNDGGWNTRAFEGLTLLQDEYGFEVSYSENVVQDEQAQVAQEYARLGYDLVVGHGFEFGDALDIAAPLFPETYFLNVGGVAGGVHPNLASAVFENGVLGYLAGRMAAEMTGSGRVGFVGAMEIPTVVAEVEAIVHTVEHFNPGAQVTVAYTGSWVDIGAGYEAALAQIANGTDFLIAIGDAANAGVIQAAQENDVWTFGWAGDYNYAAPEHVASSGVQSVAVIMELYGKMVQEGTWDNAAATFGIAEGTQFLGTFAPGVPAEIVELIEGEYDKFVRGEYSRQSVAEMVGIQ